MKPNKSTAVRTFRYLIAAVLAPLYLPQLGSRLGGFARGAGAAALLMPLWTAATSAWLPVRTAAWAGLLLGCLGAAAAMLEVNGHRGFPEVSNHA